MPVKCVDETKIKRIKNKIQSNLVAWFTWEDGPKQTKYKTSTARNEGQSKEREIFPWKL